MKKATQGVKMKAAPSLEYLRQHREAILELVARYGGEEVRVFGSVARGEATPDSDVDLLVTLRDEATLWTLMDLWESLQILLGYEVNLIEDDGRDSRLLRRARHEGVRF
jgi:predicted nucleotidyltransferase